MAAAITFTIFAIIALLMVLPAHAQTTTVTGTVTDPNGVPYANGTIMPVFVSPGGPTPKFTATQKDYQPPSTPTRLDSTGSFTVLLADNTFITPAATKWNFNVCSGAGTVQPSSGKGSVCFSLPAPITISGAAQSITTNLAASALLLAPPKIISGVPQCDQYPGTSFDIVMANCVAALPATGSGMVNAMNLSGAQLTMTGNWSMSRSGTVVIFGQYTVAMGVNQVLIPSPTSNIALHGAGAFATTPNGLGNGTIFRYLGTSTAIAMGDTSATSFGHLIEDIGCDLTSAGAGAHCFDSTRVYGVEFNRNRGLCPVTANTDIFIQNNGTSTAPGSQSMMVRGNVENNCQTGFSNIGQSSPPLSNHVQFIGGQFSGNGLSGGICIDIEAGGLVDFFEPYCSGYDTGLKVASISGRAVWGVIRSESCTTQGFLFTVGTSANEIWTDSGGACATVTLNGTNNTVHFQGAYSQTPDMSTIRYRNSLDSALNFIFQAGTTADQQTVIQWNDHLANKTWTFGMDSALGFGLRDGSGNARIVGTTTSLSLECGISTSNPCNINDTTNGATGGVQFWTGGASPTVGASISGPGKGTFNGITASGTSLNTLGSTVVASLPAAASNSFAQVGVTDSTAIASEGQTCVGGGAVKAVAISNGSVWKCF